MAGRYLREVQRLATSGARGVAAFTVGGVQRLAIPQLAYDAPGSPSGMNGGDSNTDILLFDRRDGEFAPTGRLPGPGAEDVEYFEVDGTPFLACACIRIGSGPYNFSVGQPLYRWGGNAWEPFQTIVGHAAKQWRHFTVGGVHHLALAQNRPGGPELPSRLYRWTGTEFGHLQDIPSRIGYNFHAFDLDGTSYLAHADHLLPSRLYRWDGAEFVPHQDLMPAGGRAFATFAAGGERYLAVANIQSDSILLRWENGRFVDHAVLGGGTGGRELLVVDTPEGLFMVRVDFITGGPADPHPLLKSPLYKFEDGTFRVVEEYDTSGGTDVALVAGPGGGRQLVVSHGLNGRLGFETESVVYAFSPAGDL
ncbi:hypothetical protein [Amycolatopsis sp. NPDC051371]|uniref:hypothetical protein n=1 Tax=Amycolatopsis sp. NPDC051371 TaxID=3155800 RepID=UPI00341417E9